MPGNVFIHKVEIDSRVGCCHLITQDIEENVGFTCLLSDGLNFYKARCDEKTLLSMSAGVDMEMTRYWDLVMQAFGCVDWGSSKFSYQFDDDASTRRKFSWKHVLPGGVKFSLGSLEMEKVVNQPALIVDILDRLMKEMNDLQKELSVANSTCLRLEADQNVVMKRFESCVQEKRDLETNLYSKFCLVLNEKKAKIRSLKESSVEEVPAVHLHKEDDEDTDRESDGDVENGKKQSAAVTSEREVLPGPVPVVAGSRIIFDNSVYTEAEEPSKRRKRARQTRAPVPVALPRTTSLFSPNIQNEVKPSDEAGNRKSKVARSSDAEDLLGQL